MGPPGAAAPARKRLALGTLLPRQESGLAKIHGFGEADRRQTEQLPGNRTMQTRPSRRGFALRVLGYRPRENRDRTRRIARTWRACPIIASPSTQQALRLVRRDSTRLDDTAGGTVFLGIRDIGFAIPNPGGVRYDCAARSYGRARAVARRPGASNRAYEPIGND